MFINLFDTLRISLTLLFSVSFRIKRKLGRLIIFIILLIITSITCFVFSIIPNNLNHSSTLKRLSNRISFLLSASTGAWLFCSIGIDLFIKIGLLEGFTLLVSDNGIFKNGPPSSSSDDGDNVDEFVNVVKWNEGKCKGFLAGMWLL